MNKDKDKMREVISILMESSLYFDFSLYERRAIVVRLVQSMNWA